MILLPKSVKIYAATEPANLRKSFEGLSNEVRTVLAADPLLCGGRRYVAEQHVTRGTEGLSLLAVARRRHIFPTLSRRRRTASVGLYRGVLPVLTPAPAKASRIISTSASA